MTGESNNLDFFLTVLLASEAFLYIFLKENVSMVTDFVGKDMMKSVSTTIAKTTVKL